MTVAELIAKLHAMPQDLAVVCFDDGNELMPLKLDPRVEQVFKFPTDEQVFEGAPGEEARQRGAGAPFDVVFIGIAP